MPDPSRAPGSASEAVAAILPMLREAFAREVSVRLPRLLEAASEAASAAAGAAAGFVATGGATATADALRRVVSDAHALGSSAAVVGEEIASCAARECEALFSSYAGLGRLPADATAGALRAVEAVAVSMAGWLVDPAASGEA